MPWLIAAIIVGLFVLLWLLAELKTSRPDGDLAKVHPYRKMMPIIMRTRNESVVYFEYDVDATQLLAYLEQHREALGCNISHLIVATIAATLHKHPKLNRFIAGQRIYQRRGVWLSFSMMRKKLNSEGKLATVKLEAEPQMSFVTLCEAVNAKIDLERSDDETYLDKELSLFFKLPHFMLKRAARFLFWANDHNLLPASFIRDDSMFTGVYIANLGSLGMEAAYHHIYEWGNCPLFVVVGKLHEREVLLDDGTYARRPVLPLRFTYDERVEDGLNAGRAIASVASILKDPAATFGEDGLQLLSPTLHASKR